MEIKEDRWRNFGVYYENRKCDGCVSLDDVYAKILGLPHMYFVRNTINILVQHETTSRKMKIFRMEHF